MHLAGDLVPLLFCSIEQFMRDLPQAGIGPLQLLLDTPSIR